MDRWKHYEVGRHVDVVDGVLAGERGRIVDIVVTMNLHFIHVKFVDGGLIPFRPIHLQLVNALEELSLIDEVEDR